MPVVFALLCLVLLVPAAPATAAITTVELVIRTGDDDLRGGNDNVNATIVLRDGREIRFDNINHSARWPGGSQQTVPLSLTLRIGRNIESRSDIVGLILQTTFRGGFDGDNWDMSYLKVTPIESTLGGGGRLAPYYEQTRPPYSGSPSAHRSWRFTGLNRPFAVRWGAGRVTEVSHIVLLIRTGDDDLRGGNDNVNVRILYRGGEQYVRNINRSQNWPNGSTNIVRIVVNRSTDVEDIVGIILETDSRGGFSGDNWNIDYLRVSPRLHLRPSYRDCYENEGRPLKRFTGDERSFRISCRM